MVFGFLMMDDLIGRGRSWRKRERVLKERKKNEI